VESTLAEKVSGVILACMRIIAGEHRGRRLKTPPGQGTRPMLDRVREALFSTLGELVVDARVLDLCAGTGSLGLESLSRGAESARMVEQDRKVVQLLRSNVEMLRLGERAEPLQADVLDPWSWGEGARYEIVFLDPPYPWLRDARRRAQLLEAVRRLVAGHLTPGGVVVLHAPRGALRAEDFGPGLASRLREYGTNALWYLRQEAAEVA
jgi:16S rRNA (guanine966-N2)-methyltransferase